MTITDADVRKFMTLSSVLCETQDVRVYAHGEKRFLQFRATGVPRSRPWQYNEAIIICEESFPNQQCGDTISVASSIPVASAARRGRAADVLRAPGKSATAKTGQPPEAQS